MIFCARATRGLRRPSLDARSRGQPRPLPPIQEKRTGVRPGDSLCSRNARSRTPLARANGTSLRASGGRVRKLRALWETARPPLQILRVWRVQWTQAIS